MNYKEKYEMALEGIQEILSSGEDSIKMSRLQLRLQGIFPELKESEDEKIKEQVIYAINQLHVCDCTKNKLLAWIERQGEQKSADITDKLKEEYQKGWDAAMQQLPKEVDSQIWQIANNSAKTWEESFAILHASQKAYDKGRKDASKEQKLTWSEEDEQTFNKSVEALEELGKEITKDKETATKFLKSAGIMDENGELAEPYRVCESTSNWSEGDEKMLNGIIDASTHHCYLNITDIDWLKSLKEKVHPQNTWKPSEEQMDALNLAIGEANSVDTAAGDEAAEILTSLYEQLKKLKE